MLSIVFRIETKNQNSEDPYIFDYPCNFDYYLVLIVLYQIIWDSFWVPFWSFRIPFMSFWFPGGSVWVNRRTCTGSSSVLCTQTWGFPLINVSFLCGWSRIDQTETR